MSGGGGGNPVDQVTKGFNDIVNFTTSYDSSTGKFGSKGSMLSYLDEGVGEITGRNQSRAGLNLARDQFNQSQADAQALVDQQRWNRMQSDIQASNMAGAERNNSGGNGPSYSTTTPLGMGSGSQGKEFLGL